MTATVGSHAVRMATRYKLWDHLALTLWITTSVLANVGTWFAQPVVVYPPGGGWGCTASSAHRARYAWVCDHATLAALQDFSAHLLCLRQVWSTTAVRGEARLDPVAPHDHAPSVPTEPQVGLVLTAALDRIEITSPHGRCFAVAAASRRGARRGGGPASRLRTGPVPVRAVRRQQPLSRASECFHGDTGEGLRPLRTDGMEAPDGGPHSAPRDVRALRAAVLGSAVSRGVRLRGQRLTRSEHCWATWNAVGGRCSARSRRLPGPPDTDRLPTPALVRNCRTCWLGSGVWIC